MTVYEIPNINNCTVTPVMSGETVLGYRIVSNEGWYIHVNNGVEGNENLYKTAVLLTANYDFSLVEIVPESELPEGAEIFGTVTPPTVTE